ncbi:Craniofacial development protein 2 [Acanthosepion pharaonis]|uniref:Craniofacial development protein 2 n=1 Tax=Acanthosepion pharaonis TaxID=158019 RepID=A0A812CWU7_ACAPH|nr:Craniofacial development protein 2 [Sepia pharaonis]
MNNTRASAACVSDAPVFWSAEPVRNQQATTVLARRDVMKIAGWNARTLREEGTQSLTVRTLYKYGVCVACLSEKPVFHRLAMVRLKSAVINVTVISVYAPTLNAAEEDKDIFYRDLQAVVHRSPSTHLQVVAGNWNARTGPADEDTRHVLGRFALGTRCDNGDPLVKFAVANRIVMTNTRFQHLRRHLVTWRSNDGRTSNQIDYILVRARWVSSVLDSRAYWVADTGSAHGSDHTLVRASLRLRLRARISTKILKRMNVANLKLRAGEHGTRPSWFHPSPISGLDHQGEPSAGGGGEGSATDRSCELSRSTAPRNSSALTENAAACGDSRKLYQMVRRTSCGTTGVSETLRSRDGAIIAGLGEWLNRWNQHFNELLNHAIPAAEVAVEPTDEYDCNTAPPTVPGEDGIPAEVYKAVPDVFASWVHRVFNAVWLSEAYPADWSEAILLPFLSERVIGDSARTTEESASSTWWPKYLQCFSCEDFKESVICELARLRVVSAWTESVLIRSSACGASSNNAASSTLGLLSTPLIEAHSGVSWRSMACPPNSFVSSRATTCRREPVFVLMLRSRRH